MTTETDSLGSFKNSFIFFPQEGTEVFQAHEGLVGAGGAAHPGRLLRALVPPPRTVGGAQIIK